MFDKEEFTRVVEAREAKEKAMEATETMESPDTKVRKPYEFVTPDYYNLEGLDVKSIDVLHSILGDEYFFNGFCKGLVLKYLIREKNKGGMKDLKKAYDFLGWIVENEKLEDK